MARNVQKTERETSEPARRHMDPFTTLRSEMDRLFDSFMGGGFNPMPRLFTPGVTSGAVMPHMDVRENAKEIVVEAELPGIEEDDVTLTLQDGVLTLKGEKRFERDETGDDMRVMERRFGSFQRALRLPDTVAEDKVEASFDKGVLTVRLPKRPEAVKQERKIQIKGR